MGFWDAVNSTTDTIKRNVPDTISVTNSVSSVADTIKQNIPDMTPVANAVNKIGDTVRVKEVQKLKENLPDSEGWKEIGRSVKDVVDGPAGEEVSKLFPGGGSAYRIYKGLNPKRDEVKDLKQEVKGMRAEIEKLKKDRAPRLDAEEGFKITDFFGDQFC
ncbi:PREDICTED: uncharacterized protein LOC104605666 [Nelumbo nucifera]|uniref:Uncharacterized protein LOC104605666 n=2 Tax=Nelumbo nucifera TaxID=4432 RepID=A0A1U8AR61_NELNU|nr:PREDICTED: uncharacterized protein LOC104605666 [Nelumbo nucifera]DAD23033.1 TPA_asm: hypothetical protein HUJ06_024496 [Nelumbo nucifera]